MTKGLVFVQAYDRNGDLVLTLGLVARSAIHKELTRRDGRGGHIEFYLASIPVNAGNSWMAGKIIGVGKRAGNGWSRSAF